MDLSQITMSLTAPGNQFTYDQSERDKVALCDKRRRLQALWFGTSASLTKFAGATRRLLGESAQIAGRPQAAK